MGDAPGDDLARRGECPVGGLNTRMPSLGYMWRSATSSALLGYVLVVVGLLLLSTCLAALKEWALERRQHLPAALLAVLASLALTAFGGYIVYRTRS